MKQVSNAVNSFVLSSPRHHLIAQRAAFSKYLLVFLLAGFVMLISSCQKDQKIKCVPFKGKYTYDIGTNTGTGTASPIGSFSIVEPNNSVVRNADGSLVVTGTALITAENGDKIVATHSGLVTIKDGMAQVHAVFTIKPEGTGRFAEATGSFESNRAFGEESYTIDGTICY